MRKALLRGQIHEGGESNDFLSENESSFFGGKNQVFVHLRRKSFFGRGAPGENPGMYGIYWRAKKKHSPSEGASPKAERLLLGASAFPQPL